MKVLIEYHSEADKELSSRRAAQRASCSSFDFIERERTPKAVSSKRHCSTTSDSWAWEYVTAAEFIAGV